MIAPKKEQSDHKTGIMQNQFDHSPPQTTLTKNKWIDTKKVGRDDAEIRRTKLAVEAERKRKRKKEKPFAHGTSVVETVENTEISELSQPVVEAVVYESSDDQNFDGQLISPAEKRMRNVRKVDESTDGDATLKTPTKSDLRKNRNKNSESVMLRDLRRHIINQNNVIADLNRKLEIIRDVASDANSTDTRQIMKNNTKINLLDKIDGLEVDVEDSSPTKSSSRNVINLHFN